MSDRPKDIPTAAPADTPPPDFEGSWEDSPAFREIFLMHWPGLAADSFRQAGQHLYDAAIDRPLDPLDRPPEPWVRARVRALAADLRFTARVFASLADAREAADLSIPEHQLASKCEVWAGEILALVLNIEGALDSEAGS